MPSETKHAGRRRHAEARQLSVQLLVRFGYSGDGFHGLAPQPGWATVGEAVLQHVATLAGGQWPYALSLAARTDAGVHAAENFLSCRLRLPLAPGTKTTLPKGLHILQIWQLPRRAMVRHSALRKTYIYKLATPDAGCPAPSDPSWQLQAQLDLPHMRAAAVVLQGHHDFWQLKRSRCDARQSVQLLQRLEVVALGGGRVHIVAEAASFFRKQVRTLVALLVEVGLGLRDVVQLRRLLEPPLAASELQARVPMPLAPARGLCLQQVMLDPALWHEACSWRPATLADAS